MRFGPLALVGIGTLLLLSAPAALIAQLSGAVDASATWVRYDGFLASGAAALSTSLRYDRPRLSLGARGVFLVYQSGNQSRQLLASGAGYAPLVGPVWVEGSLEGGLSRYADFARFAHGQARARAHLLSHDGGLWAGGSAGAADLGDGAEATAGWEAGAWRRTGPLRLVAVVSGTQVGDTAYTDVVGRARLPYGAVELEAGAGARLLSTGGGRGLYGEATATWWLGDGTALTASAGRYPSDPPRGSVPGRYVSLVLRLTRSARARPASGAAALGRAAALGDLGTDGLPPDASAPRIEFLRRGSSLLLRVLAPGAARVELMGDFTAWEPVAMAPAGGGSFELMLAPGRGLHRFNVRVDGGSWTVPAGVRVTADEFGGFVGTIVVN
jgi:hypothetical protein